MSKGKKNAPVEKPTTEPVVEEVIEEVVEEPAIIEPIEAEEQPKPMKPSFVERKLKVINELENDAKAKAQAQRVLRNI